MGGTHGVAREVDQNIDSIGAHTAGEFTAARPGHEHEVVSQGANLLGLAVESGTHGVYKNFKVRAIVVLQNGRQELEHWMPMQIWRQIADGEPALGIA